MCHSSCTLIRSGSTIHLWPVYASTRMALFCVGVLVSLTSWPSSMSGAPLPLGIKDPSSSWPIYFSIVVLWVGDSLISRALMISDLIVHPPLIPWSMLAWSYSGSDINRRQHSILLPGPSAMYPHDNPLRDPNSWLDSSLIHGFHRISWLSQAGSDLSWSHLSPRRMSHHAFHMDALNLSSNWREKLGLRSMFRIHPVWGAQLTPFRGLK